MVLSGESLAVKLGNIINQDWDLKVALYLMNLRNKLNDVNFIQFSLLEQFIILQAPEPRKTQMFKASVFGTASVLFGRKLTIQFQ